MSKIFDIVKSRFIDGKSLPQWYEDRLAICAGCELNSKNIESKDKGAFRKGWELIAGAHCTDPSCGCTISEKAKLEEQECPQKKWLSVVANAIKSQSYAIQNLSPENVKLGKQGIYYYLDFGTMEYMEDRPVKLRIDVTQPKNVSAKGSCGCLTVSSANDDSKIELDIKYNTSLVGPIEGRSVRVDYYKNGIKSQIAFLIKGQVIKTN